MKYSQAKRGRTFVLRMEDGDILHETIEEFAVDKDIQAASMILVGGADKGSTIVAGPENGEADNPIAMTHIFENVHEIAGVGTLFPDENGEPKLHMHISAGRKNSAKTGCVRKGVKTWLINEVILYEIIDTDAIRKHDSESGFTLLEP